MSQATCANHCDPQLYLFQCSSHIFTPQSTSRLSTLAAIPIKIIPHQAWPARLISAFLALQIPNALSYQFLPEHNITCLGDGYDLTLPLDGDFDPNELTMEKLCADPQLGGSLPYRHIGGFGRYDSRDNSNTRLVFDGTDSISNCFEHGMLPTRELLPRP